MIYLKRFDNVEETNNTQQVTPFVGIVKNIPCKAVFASRKKYGLTAEVVKDNKDFITIRSINVVVGKSIPVTAMPYMWYYCKGGTKFIKSQRPLTKVICNGEEINFSRVNEYIYEFNTPTHILIRVVKYDSNGLILETKSFNGNSVTTIPGVEIQNYEIVNKRPVIANSGIDEVGGIQIVTDRPARVKYMRNCGRNTKHNGHYHIRRFGLNPDYTSHTQKVRVQNVAKKRWVSQQEIIVDFPMHSNE